MNKKDEFWFFVIRAISATGDDQYQYYYNKPKNVLFAIKRELANIQPLSRQPVDENSVLKEKVIKLIKSDANIKLDRLSLAEKKQLLNKALDCLTDVALKNSLEAEVDALKETDKLIFKKDLRKINFLMFLQIDMRLNNLLTKEISLKYFPLGISEETNILW